MDTCLPTDNDFEIADPESLATAGEEPDADPRTVSHEIVRACLLRLSAAEFDAAPLR